MKYYILKGTIKGTGANPQSETYKQSVNYNHPDSARNLDYDLDFKCKLEYIDLVKRAKITDLIDTPANKVMAKVVSQKFVDVVSKFDSSSFNLYPVKLRKGGKVYEDYYMLKFNEDSFVHINNKESKIRLNFKGAEFDFSNYDLST